MIFIFPTGTGCIFSGIHLTNTGISSIMAMKCNRFVTNSLIFSYRSVLTSVGERINNEEKKKNHAGSIRSDVCDALYAAEGGGCKKGSLEGC